MCVTLAIGSVHVDVTHTSRQATCNQRYVCDWALAPYGQAMAEWASPHIIWPTVHHMYSRPAQAHGTVNFSMASRIVPGYPREKAWLLCCNEEGMAALLAVMKRACSVLHVCTIQDRNSFSGT